MMKVELVDKEELMSIVEGGGLDDDMYEVALEELENMQIKYNELVDHINKIEESGN